jgi:hypothetical protein
MSEPLELRAIRSTLGLERTIAARNTAWRAEAEELLRITAAQLRGYERHHLAKSPPDTIKAETNAALAARIEALLGKPAPTTTGEA